MTRFNNVGAVFIPHNPWVVANINGDYIVLKNGDNGVPVVCEDLLSTEQDAQDLADRLNRFEGMGKTSKEALLYPRSYKLRRAIL